MLELVTRPGDPPNRDSVACVASGSMPVANPRAPHTPLLLQRTLAGTRNAPSRTDDT